MATPSTIQYLVSPSLAERPMASGRSHEEAPVTLLNQKPFSAVFQPRMAGRSQVDALVTC